MARPRTFVQLLHDFKALIMQNYTPDKLSSQENSDKAKALKKLMAKWFTTKDTRRKADLLLEKNPKLKVPGTHRHRGEGQ